MPFFKQLRRRSKASFHSDSKTAATKVEMVGKSSSTIDTSSHSSITPPSSIKPTLSSPSLPALTELNGNASLPPPPQRPGPFVTRSQRNSVVVCNQSTTQRNSEHGANWTSREQGSSSSSINGVYRSQPSSPYAPRIVSITENSWVSFPVKHTELLSEEKE